MELEIAQQHTYFLVAVKRLFTYLFAAAISILCSLIVLNLWDIKLLYTPFVYTGDELFYTMTIQSVLDTGWYLTNPMIGAPGIHTLVDFPTPEGCNYLILKFISLFTSNSVLITNLFYLLTFPLITLSSFFVMNRLGLRTPFALTASILFAFLPYHFIRGTNHLFLSAYYTTPLAIWLCILIYKDQLWDQADHPPLTRRKKTLLFISYLLACILIGSTGVYYAYFGCFFLGVAGLITTIRTHKKHPIFHAFALISLITLTVIGNILPTLINHHQQGPNPKASHRSIGETEHYGLKISQLLLPVDQDRIKPLAKIKKKYNHYNAWNENTTATLGLVASLGFLILIAQLFNPKKERETSLGLSHLNLSALLIATIGGFSSIISLLLLKEIRCYNRISIYIAFFSITALFLALQRQFHTKKATMWSVCILLLTFGIYNQTSPNFSLTQTFAARNRALTKDRLFFNHIDQLMPPRSRIFQLPYISFPEGNHPLIGNYDHFRAALHAPHLKWSFGAIKGREIDLWQKTVSSASIPDMLEELIAQGFTGLYIDRKGYKDHGAKIESELLEMLKAPPFENNDASFWDLRKALPALFSDLDRALKPLQDCQSV